MIPGVLSCVLSCIACHVLLHQLKLKKSLNATEYTMLVEFSCEFYLHAWRTTDWKHVHAKLVRPSFGGIYKKGWALQACNDILNPQMWIWEDTHLNWVTNLKRFIASMHWALVLLSAYYMLAFFRTGTYYPTYPMGLEEPNNYSICRICTYLSI